tara:strand:+ start:1612 stop:2046 length:435 start_codon:yes stop_codon:yes gene_type:complete
MKRLYISKKMNLSPKKVALIGDFINFCVTKLPLKSQDLEIQLVDNRKNSGVTTTAYYAPGKNLVVVYCKNRAVVDVLRSVAHELTHMMQDEQGMLVGEIQDAGGFHEDQANAKAGELIKLYAKSHPQRKAIYENLKLRKFILKS